MNDRFDFRGLTDSGMWVHGHLYNDDGDYYIRDEYEIGYKVKPETIGQCTGLKDRNGTPIYEKDFIIYKKDFIKFLVAQNKGRIRKGTIALVEWNNSTCCGFVLSGIENLTEKRAKKCEVVGNIQASKEFDEWL